MLTQLHLIYYDKDTKKYKIVKYEIRGRVAIKIETKTFASEYVARKYMRKVA